MVCSSCQLTTELCPALPAPQVRASVGNDSLLLVHADTLSEPSALARIGKFARLPPEGFDRKLLAERTNDGGTTADRGAQTIVPSGSGAGGHHSGTYQISHYEPMHNDTRRLIYERERGACEALAKEFGVGCWAQPPDLPGGEAPTGDERARARSVRGGKTRGMALASEARWRAMVPEAERR